jgi:hypothetical protein
LNEKWWPLKKVKIADIKTIVEDLQTEKKGNHDEGAI